MRKTGIFDNLMINPKKVFGEKSWQQLALLEHKEVFVKEFQTLQRKWLKEIKEGQKITKKLINLLRENPKVCGENVDKFVQFFNNNLDYCLETAIMHAPIPQNNITKLCSLSREYLELRKNPQVEEVIKNLVQKYKLLSADFSFTALMTAFYKDSFPFLFYNIYRDLREKIWRCLPVNTQFTLGINQSFYPFNNETKLVLYLNDYCSREDIESHWGIISNKLKELRKMKGIEERYYPLKNLKRGIKAVKTKKGKITYYDPDENKNIEKKETDLDIGIDVLGEQKYDSISIKKGRKGVSNLVRQIRYQYKKKLK